jgi:predicted Zn-dependent protease
VNALPRWLHFSLLFSLLLAPLLFPPVRARAEITLADELEMGRRFNQLLRASTTMVQDPEIADYTEYLLRRLLAHIPPQPFRFSLSLVRDDTPNAFAVPGGYIFLHTGLVLAMRHESEVAGVLAHELAHITQRHIARRIAQAQRINILSAVGLLAGAFLGGGGDASSAAVMGSLAAGQSAMLNYSRVDETEADQMGVASLSAAGYPLEGMIEAFRIIQRPQWVSGSDIPAYLSTHPATSERITELTARLHSLKKAVLTPSPEEDKRFMLVQTLIRGRYSSPENALRFFEEQRNKREHRAMAYLGLGLVYERMNRVGEADAAFKSALEENPGHQLFLREAGRFNYLKGDKTAAILLLQQATAQNPGDYAALFYYARLLDDSGQTEQALEYYRQVLRYQPEDVEAHYRYAILLGREHRAFQARLHLAYSALYENNPIKTEQQYKRLKNMPQDDKDQEDLSIFEKRYADRRAYW